MLLPSDRAAMQDGAKIIAVCGKDILGGAAKLNKKVSHLLDLVQRTAYGTSRHTNSPGDLRDAGERSPVPAPGHIQVQADHKGSRSVIDVAVDIVTRDPGPAPPGHRGKLILLLPVHPAAQLLIPDIGAGHSEPTGFCQFLRSLSYRGSGDAGQRRQRPEGPVAETKGVTMGIEDHTHLPGGERQPGITNQPVRYFEGICASFHVPASFRKNNGHPLTWMAVRSVNIEFFLQASALPRRSCRCRRGIGRSETGPPGGRTPPQP